MLGRPEDVKVKIILLYGLNTVVVHSQTTLLIKQRETSVHTVLFINMPITEKKTQYNISQNTDCIGRKLKNT